MFIGMELASRAEWWDLFCSVDCCKAVHGEERPETFIAAEDFQERTRVNLRNEPRGSTNLRCFCCHKPLDLNAPKLGGISLMKYVVGFTPVSDHLYPVVFPEEVTHSSIALALNRLERLKIRSAGFVRFNVEANEWTVDQQKRSESLKLGPDPGDQLLLNLFLGQGLAGLELNNMLAMLSLTANKLNDGKKGRKGKK